VFHYLSFDFSKTFLFKNKQKQHHQILIIPKARINKNIPIKIPITLKKKYISNQLI